MEPAKDITPLTIEPIPAFRDNYIWLISQTGSERAWIVDPGDAQPVLRHIHKNGLQLEGILLTHHHPDHTGGIPALLEHFPLARVVRGGTSVDVLGRQFKIIEVPGHTLDHVAFYCAGEATLFSGDTLFSCGCGRLFEGTAEQMYHSLALIAALPGNTLNYCAHEYTQSNIRFALAADKDNRDLQDRSADTDTQRTLGQPTTPSTLSLELATNPFLRCHEPSIMASVRSQTEARLESPLDVFTALRAWKDRF